MKKDSFLFISAVSSTTINAFTGIQEYILLSLTFKKTQFKLWDPNVVTEIDSTISLIKACNIKFKFCNMGLGKGILAIHMVSTLENVQWKFTWKCMYHVWLLKHLIKH